MALSMVANILVSRHLYHVAKQTDSQALSADAAHLRTDVLTSLGVLVGLLLARVTGFTWMDPLVASAVAVVLLATAFRLSRDAIQLLLDTRLPAEEEDVILGNSKLGRTCIGLPQAAHTQIGVAAPCGCPRSDGR